MTVSKQMQQPALLSVPDAPHPNAGCIGWTYSRVACSCCAKSLWHKANTTTLGDADALRIAPSWTEMQMLCFGGEEALHR